MTNNSLREYSRCVLTKEPERECTIVDAQTIKCNDITVEASVNNIILVSCYNLFTGNTGMMSIFSEGTYFEVDNYLYYELNEDFVVDYIT